MMASMKHLAIEAIRSSGWLVWAPLLAIYAPRGLPKMYFNMHLRRHARRLVPFLDPFVTIDIVSNYKEVEAYLTKVCSGDALAFCARGTPEGCSFLLRLREGQEVADHFRGVTVWWLLEENCRLRLMFPQRHKALILDEYLPHVCRTGREDSFVAIDIVADSHFMYTDDPHLQRISTPAFQEVKAYLNSPCSRDALDLNAEGTVKGDSFLFSLRKGEEMADSFRGVIVRWLSIHTSDNSDHGMPNCFRLMFRQQHRALVLEEYLPHVRQQGQNIMIGKRGKRLYTNEYNSWSHIDFEHPTTFDTLAMDLKTKRKIMEDLDNFCGNKDYYRRIGKPWKRGYLLYGPPGTGKSTMIAAMANYLNYDIYDIELTSVPSNSNLRKLLVNTTSKSIIVFEDIDCCFDDVTGQRSNQGRRTSLRYNDDNPNVTLSGLLNFIDGVWSAHSGERIVVLTTNFPDKLDSALVRSGRMDMHIEMSYCCFEAFKTLARNYLGVGAHPLFQTVEELLQVVEITPADVAECLLCPQTDFPGSSRGVETCIRRLIDELQNKAAHPKKRQRRRQ